MSEPEDLPTVILQAEDVNTLKARVQYLLKELEESKAKECKCGGGCECKK